MTHAHGLWSGFALIIVLFILLVIIGASYVGYGYGWKSIHTPLKGDMHNYSIIIWNFKQFLLVVFSEDNNSFLKARNSISFFHFF